MIDLGLDGRITSADEFVLTNWAPETTGDLEAANGKLTALDARWSEFRVWRDLDQDGESDAGEMQTLAEAGVTAFDLDGLPVNDPGTIEPYDNVVSRLYSTFGWRETLAA